MLFQPLSEPEKAVIEFSLIVGGSIAITAYLSSVIFAIMRKWEIAKGTGICGGIGLVVWIITFALSYGMGMG